jgi:hypothetical protein
MRGNGMSNDVREFLVKRGLTIKNGALSQADARARSERYGLPTLMRNTCAFINEQAGEVLVEGHYYLPPQPLVNSFSFVRRDTEYIMQLEAILTPRLVFVERKWRDRPPSDFFNWICSVVSPPPPCRVQIPYACEIPDQPFSEEEVKKWFFYLLSGLQRSHMPSRQLAKSGNPSSVLFFAQGTQL